MRSVLRPESPNYMTMDALRFLAAMAVVAYHYRKALEFGPLAFVAQGTFSRSFQFVDLFFVLSGFIIAAVYSSRLANGADYREFLIKRVARLWPLHILLLALYIGIWGLTIVLGLELNEATKYDASCILPNVFMVHSLPLCGDGLTFNYVSWSISAEMFMYLLAPVLLLIGARQPLGLLSFAAIVFIGLGLVQVERPWEIWTYDWGVARAVPAFLLGVALFNIRGRLTAIPQPLWLLVGSLALFFVLSWVEAAPLWLTLLVMYAVAVFAAAVDAKGSAPAWVARLANFSPLTYGIYMWHPLVFTIGVSFVVKRILPVSGLVSDVLLIGCIASVIIVAWVSLVWFERPARRLISGARSTQVEAPSTP